MKNTSVTLRPRLDRVDNIPTKIGPDSHRGFDIKDRRSFTETDSCVEAINFPTRKTQSFGAGNPRTPPLKMSVSVIDENKEFVVPRSNTLESGGFSRKVSSQASTTDNPKRKTSKVGRPPSSDMGVINQSFGAGNPRISPSKLTVSVIDENKELVVPRSNTLESGGFSRNVSAQASTNDNPYRKTSKAPLSGLGVINQGFTASRASSMYGGSMGSLPVIREQYWCWSHWTKRERMFFAIIVVLSCIILCLLVGVSSILGIARDEPEKPVCLQMLFYGTCEG